MNVGMDIIKIGAFIFTFLYAFGGFVAAEETYQRCMLGVACILFIFYSSIVIFVQIKSKGLKTS